MYRNSDWACLALCHFHWSQHQNHSNCLSGQTFLQSPTCLMSKYQSQNPNAVLSMLGPQMPGFYMTFKTNSWSPWALRFPTCSSAGGLSPVAAFSCTWVHPCRLGSIHWKHTRTSPVHSNYKKGKKRSFREANTWENAEIQSLKTYIKICVFFIAIRNYGRLHRI